MERGFRRKAFPRQIGAGVAILAFALAFLGIHLLIPESLGLFAFWPDVLALAALVVGSMVVYRAFGYECLECERQLNRRAIALGEEQLEAMIEAIEAGAVDRIAELLEQGERPKEPSDPALMLWYCDTCQQVARIQPEGVDATPLVGAAARQVIVAATQGPGH